MDVWQSTDGIAWDHTDSSTTLNTFNSQLQESWPSSSSSSSSSLLLSSLLLLTKSGNKFPKLLNSSLLELIACTHIRCLRLRLCLCHLSHSNTAISATANTRWLPWHWFIEWFVDSVGWNYADSKWIDSNDSSWIESIRFSWCKRSLRCGEYCTVLDISVKLVQL